MKISTRARYALRMLIEIDRLSDGGKAVSLKDVATRTRISRRYLEQLAIGLKNGSLIHGLSGRGGGYRLARPAGQITVGQIFEAAIGPINIVDCVRHPTSCLAADVCGCRSIYQLLNNRITDVLDEFTLADLAQRDHETALHETLADAEQGCPAR